MESALFLETVLIKKKLSTQSHNKKLATSRTMCMNPKIHTSSTKISLTVGEAIALLEACNADAPIEQPQKCRQCIRFAAKQFPCPWLRHHPDRQAKA